MKIDGLSSILESIDVSIFVNPLRDQVILAASGVAASNMLLPSIFAQIAIGMYCGYSAAHDAYEARSEYRGSKKKDKGLLLKDFIGSPRTSPISAAAYFIAGSLNDKYRTFFFAEELYQYVKNPAPFMKKGVISVDKTFIPFCYPNFEYYTNKNDPYSRCYKAMYESAFTTAHQKPESTQQYFYGQDSAGQYYRYRVDISSFGAFSIVEEKELSFLSKMRAFFGPHYSREQIADKMQHAGKYLTEPLTADEEEICRSFKVLGHLSEEQACTESTKLRTMQITLPDDRELDPMSDLTTLLNLIERHAPERLVFHQQKASDIAQKNALLLAAEINRLRAVKQADFPLQSLAYHSENPQTSIKNPEHFYSFFSEVCTMGYNNPQDIRALMEASERLDTEENHSEETPKIPKNTSIKSQELSLESPMDWPETRVYHIKLQRPPFEWQSVPKTFLAMLIHDFVFEIYGVALAAFKSAKSPENLLDVVSIGLIFLSGLLSSTKIAVQLSLLPIRLVFSISAASYLYLSGKKDNLFEVGPTKNFDAALKHDDFAHKEISEQIFSYRPASIQFSPAPQLEPAQQPVPKKQSAKRRRKKILARPKPRIMTQAGNYSTHRH